IGPTPVGFVTGYSSLCDAGLPIVVSGEDGAFSLDVTADTPVSFTLSKACYFDTISGPFSFSDAWGGVRPFILSHAWKPYFPDYISDTATILVNILVTTSACDAGGVLVRVPDQPNARVSYPQSDAGIGASVLFAVIGSLSPGGFATVERTKPSCVVDFALRPQVGTFPLVAG